MGSAHSGTELRVGLHCGSVDNQALIERRRKSGAVSVALLEGNLRI
jgi:hypothetical protein